MLINNICEHLGKRIENGELDNDDIVKIIELCGGYLNLQTLSDYSRANNISYNGAKNFRNRIDLFGVKFIIDNQ